MQFWLSVIQPLPAAPAPRGVPQVEMPFDIDALMNNVLNGTFQYQMTIANEKILPSLAYRKINAKKCIEKHCRNMQQILSEEKLKDKFTKCDKKIVEKAVRETIDWLKEDQLATMDDIETKMYLFDGAVNPIMKKVYQAAKKDMRKRRRVSN
jgi:L1 cell adhesion molecule like protein